MITMRKGKLNRRIQAARTFCVSFIRGSSIHGVRYLIKSDLAVIERGFWYILLLVSMYCCWRIGLQSLEHYYNKSTVIGLDRNYYSWNITIPSITICPLEHLDKQLFQEYSQKNNLSSQEHDQLFEFLENLANYSINTAAQLRFDRTLDPLLNRLNITPNSYMETIYNLTGDRSLQFIDDIDNPNKIRAKSAEYIINMRQILTAYGLCYISNTYLPLEYSANYMIRGILPKSNIESSKLYMNIKTSNLFDEQSNYNILGYDRQIFLVLVHSPFDINKPEENLGHISDSISINVESIEIVTDETFGSDTSIRRRKCRFQNENNLKYFSIYTRTLCQLECHVDLFYKQCKCIPYRFINKGEYIRPVCHYRIFRKCLMEHRAYIRRYYEVDAVSEMLAKCPCLQNCEDAMVNVKSVIIKKVANMFIGGNSISISLGNLKQERLKRQIIFSFTDLLGNNFSLFLGSCALTFIEVFVYFISKMMKILLTA